MVRHGHVNPAKCWFAVCTYADLSRGLCFGWWLSSMQSSTLNVVIYRYSMLCMTRVGTVVGIEANGWLSGGCALKLSWDGVFLGVGGSSRASDVPHLFKRQACR